MDQIKIGKFIAEERKNKKYTQRQLADILGISDKTISKWERGNGFPEISLLLPLCEELEITVNELLSGERVEDIDYKKKAEENMVNMIREKEENKKKMYLSFIIGGMSLVTFITLILIVSAYVDVISTPAKVAIVIIACTMLAIGVYVVSQGERTIGYYKCKNCSDTFIPTVGEYFIAMHMHTTRRLKCPHCGKKTWCKKIYSKED